MEPITRQEIFLASAAGESTQDLKPITRLEHFLKNVADHVKSIGNGGGTGGGASIDVTAQVGQTIVVKEVDANGKPTAWESADYQPRTHWSEPAEVLPETTVEIDPETGAGFLPDMAIVAGDKCTVNYNGTEYVCECVDTDADLIALGNLGAADESFPNTGEPFVVFKSPIDEAGTTVWLLMPFDGSESVTLSIVGQQTAQTIPNRYLDRGWLDSVVDEKLTPAVQQLSAQDHAVYTVALNMTLEWDVPVTITSESDFTSNRRLSYLLSAMAIGKRGAIGFNRIEGSAIPLVVEVCLSGIAGSGVDENGDFPDILSNGKCANGVFCDGDNIGVLTVYAEGTRAFIIKKTKIGTLTT